MITKLLKVEGAGNDFVLGTGLWAERLAFDRDAPADPHPPDVEVEHAVGGEQEARAGVVRYAGAVDAGRACAAVSAGDLARVAIDAESEGRVVGQGKHQDLIQSCETYQEIAFSQLSEEELS